MLQRLEAALRERQNWTVPELARALGARPELVRAALGHLERLGRLSPGAVLPLGGCPPGLDCSRCPWLQGCSGTAPGGPRRGGG